MAIEAPLGADTAIPGDSNYVNAPCKAHVIVTDADEDGMRLGGRNNKGEMVVEVEVLAATNPYQEGLISRIYFTKSAAAAFRIHRAAVALGLISSEALKQLQEKGEHPVYDFEPGAIDKQMFVEFVPSTFNEKTTIKVENRMFHLASKQCMDETQWPRNATFIAKSGVTMPTVKKTGTTAGASGATAGKSSTQSNATSSKPAGALAGLNLN